MKYILLRDEKSIAELVESAYKGLSMKDRTKAEAAMLKANANLKSLGDVSKGTIIQVPTISKTDTINSRSVVDPVQQITAFMADHLNKMESAVHARYTAQDNYLKDTSGKFKEISRVVKGDPVAEENAALLKKSIDATLKSGDADKKERLAEIDQLQKIVAQIGRDSL